MRGRPMMLPPWLVFGLAPLGLVSCTRPGGPQQEVWADPVIRPRAADGSVTEAAAGTGGTAAGGAGGGSAGAGGSDGGGAGDTGRPDVLTADTGNITDGALGDLGRSGTEGSNVLDGGAGRPGAEVGGSGGAGGMLGFDGGRDLGPLTGCAALDYSDLDMNNVADCMQTIAMNSTFVTDISAWNMTAGTTMADWTAVGAGGARTGAIRASNVQFQSGATISVGTGPEQCVPASPGRHAVYAETFISGSDGAGWVNVNLQFFKNDDCSMILGGFQSSNVSVRNSWTVIQGEAMAPSETRSMKIRLALNKSLSQPSFAATFDHVLVKPMR